MLKRIYTRVHAPARGKARLLGLFVVLAGAATVITAFPTHQANAATSSYLNFQARLLTSTGTVVPDGNYHIEFKIYDSISLGASAQGVCSLDSSTDDCWWIETRSTGNLVRVVNGYFSVNLGSVTAFGSTIPWDQQLYLTMRIGGTGGSPSWDPEMLSSGNRMVLTGVPYAFRAAKLASFNGTQTGTLSFGAVTNSPVLTLPNETGTVCSTGSVCTGYAPSTLGTGYIQNGTSTQTANFNIQSAANGSIGALIQGASAQTADVLKITTPDRNAYALLINNTTFSSVDTGGFGIWQENTGQSILSNNNTNPIVLGTNGNVGIGPGTSTGSNPASILTVSGTGSTGGLFRVTDTTATAQNVLDIADGGATTFRNQTDSTTAFQIQNAAGTPYFIADSTTTKVTIGTSSTAASSLTVNGATGTDIVKLIPGAGGAADTGYINVNNRARFGYDGSNVRIDDSGIGKGFLLNLSSNNVFSVSSIGAATFKNGTNSVAAFQIQNANGSSLLGVDTSNQKVTSGALNVGTVTGNRVFSDNFESGSFGLWDTASGAPTIDTSTVFNGKYSARVNTSASFLYEEKNITGAATMYARGYVNIASASTKSSLFSLYNSTDGFAGSEITAYRNAGGNIAIYSGAAALDCVVGGAMSTGAWHKVELKVIISNTGSCAITLDDTTTTSGTVDTLGTINPNRFSIGPHNGADTANTYYDELAVDTQAVDYSGSANVQDTLHVGGSSIFGGAAFFQNASDSAAAFQVKNVAGNTYLSVDTSGATVSVGNTGIASTIQIGNTTGAVAQTIGIGNNATASSTTALTIGNLLGTSATTIQGGTGASAVAIQAGNAGTITIGSQTASTANTINIGAAGLTTNSDNVSINNTSGTNSGTITLGGSGAASGTITIGQATTASNTISIGSGNLTAATQTITLGGGTTTTSGGLVLNLGTGVPGASTTKTIHIGDGGTTTGTVGITVGSIGAAAHTTTIQGGNGAGAVSIQAAASGSVYIGTTNSNNLFVGGNILAFTAPTSGATTQTATNVDTTGDVGIYDSIKIGADGLGVISYYDTTNHDLKVAHCSNVSCTSATTTSPDTTGDVGQYTSMAIAPDGFPIISYYDVTNTALKVIKCGNADCTSGNTTTTLDSQGANNTGQFTSIAIGIDGFAVISYYYATGGDLYIKHCTNATCSTSDTATALDTTNTTGQDTSIAIGTDGYPVISYYYATGLDLKFVKCNNLSCSSFATPVSLDTAQDDGAYSTMAIGTDGYPVIAYQQGTGTVGMKVAKCLNTGCTGTPTLTIVDSTVVNVGAYTSLAMGQDGYPVISYKDSTNSTMKVAKCGTASCATGNTITTVDPSTTQNYGNYTSLVVAPDGLPLISHYDSAAGDLDLRVVKCANPACSQTTGGSITGGSNIGSVTNYFNDVYAVNYYGKTFSISNFDLAEEYSVEDNSLQPGEIVALNVATGKLKRAKASDRPNLLGVVSTKPGLALRDYEHPSDDKKLIALSGKVPLKVKGDITIGDPVTISDTDGVGVRAQSGGMIVGRALENHTGDNIDSITIFVQTQQYFNICDLQGDSGIAMDINVGKLAATSLTVNGDSTFNGNVTLKGHVVGNSDTAGTVTILTGQNGITYTFTKPYASAPFVVVTATSDVGNLRYWVVKTPQQFKINLSGPAPANLQFDYLVQQ